MESSPKNNNCVIPAADVILYSLWDFLSARAENMILRWVKDDRLTMRDRAALNNKLSRLAQIDFKLAIETKFLAGPIHPHIYKLIVKGDVMLRPMLCRGPVNNELEYTLLLGAVETGGKLPKGAKEKAAENRDTVILDETRRTPHERIPNRS